MTDENKWKPQNADGDEQDEELDEAVSNINCLLATGF